MITDTETPQAPTSAEDIERMARLGSATYSPEDNKLRLYPSHRLDTEDYNKAKAAGFRWAPKQDCFFTTWDPDAEDLLVEWCGEIDDEDKTLVDRAEERAERFEGYRSNRLSDAQSARAAVSAIADNIPFGQPILVGHHSERRAQKDAEKIQNGMARCVRAFDTADYWKRRAVAARQHAEYLEQPGVRHRRIKGLESELRKMRETVAHSEKCLRVWRGEVRWKSRTTGEEVGLTHETAVEWLGTSSEHLSRCYPLDQYPRNPPASQYQGEMGLWSALGGSDGPSHAIITVEQAAEYAIGCHTRTIERCQRWISHLENRITYETEMMGESTGVAHLGERFPGLSAGWRVKARFWALPGNYGENIVSVVERVNKDREGRVNSVSVVGCRTPVPIEKVSEALPPEAGAAEKVKDAKKLPPLCNYETPDCIRLTAEEWKRWTKATDSFRATVREAVEGKHGRHRVRSRWGCYGTSYECKTVFLTDAKVVQAPPYTEPKKLAEELKPRRVETDAPQPRPIAPPDPQAAEVEAMKQALKSGVQVVSAPQLFPTPPELAEEVVAAADIEPHHRVLEPSAGTGALVHAVLADGFTGQILAIECNGQLVDGMRNRFSIQMDEERVTVIGGDFLAITPQPEPQGVGQFDRIVMNPPFERGADLKHMKHAFRFLKDGGRMVAICAQRAETQEWAETVGGGTYEPLPDGSFSEQGTNVRTALVVIDR